MEYNFVVNLGVPAHFVKKTDFAILLLECVVNLYLKHFQVIMEVLVII